MLSPSVLPPQWKFLVLSRNTPQFAVSAAKEGGGSSEEGRRPPSGRDPSLRKCVWTCTGQGAFAVTEGSVLEESWLGWGSSGWESRMEAGFYLTWGGLGEVGVPLLPSRFSSAQLTLCFWGLDPSVCVVWNRQGEGVGRAWRGHAVPASPASTRLRGDECLVMYGTVRHPSFLGVCRLLTWCSALCHLGTSGPWGHPLQMLENLGVCVICDSWLLRGFLPPEITDSLFCVPPRACEVGGAVGGHGGVAGGLGLARASCDCIHVSPSKESGCAAVGYCCDPRARALSCRLGCNNGDGGSVLLF